ncbi:recombinase RecB [Sphingobium sp. TomMM35A]
MESFRGKRIAIYARVSTKRQANNDLSVPDQIAYGERWIGDNDAVHVKTFVDAGASATNDGRGEFQAMMAMAMSEERPVDVILVHSLSRLFRNALHFMQYKAQLQRHKVRIVSITQSFGDDPASELAVGMLALFDEYHSAENSKHVKRTMLANAARGFWNGQRPPLGFKTVSVKQSKGKDRQKLEHDPLTMHVPVFIFETYVNGYQGTPVGITRLAQILNERGDQIGGKPFHTSNVHAILCNSAYIGLVMYNQRDSRTGETRPEEEWVPIPVPPLVSEDLFYAARAQMAGRDPRMGAAAVKTGTNLLTGSVICGCDGDGCGGGMTTETGKGGRYRYYACHKRSKAGLTQCAGRRVRMEALDDIVVGAVAEHVLEPTRLNALLQSWIDRSEDAQASRREQLKRLRTRLTMLDGESANVIKLVRSGVCAPDNPQVATELGNIAAQKRSVSIDIEALERQLADGARRITPAVLDSFSALMAAKLREKGNVRREYMRLLVGRVEVGKRIIRIIGSKNALSRAATGVTPHMVPKAERQWCTQEDSNLWPLPSEGNALSS